MQPWMIVLIVIGVLIVAAIVALYFLGKKAQKKQAEQQQEIACVIMSDISIGNPFVWASTAMSPNASHIVGNIKISAAL